MSSRRYAAILTSFLLVAGACRTTTQDSEGMNAPATNAPSAAPGTSAAPASTSPANPPTVAVYTDEAKVIGTQGTTTLTAADLAGAPARRSINIVGSPDTPRSVGTLSEPPAAAGVSSAGLGTTGAVGAMAAGDGVTATDARANTMIAAGTERSAAAVSPTTPAVTPTVVAGPAPVSSTVVAVPVPSLDRTGTGISPPIGGAPANMRSPVATMSNDVTGTIVAGSAPISSTVNASVPAAIVAPNTTGSTASTAVDPTVAVAGPQRPVGDVVLTDQSRPTVAAVVDTAVIGAQQTAERGAAASAPAGATNTSAQGATATTPATTNAGRTTTNRTGTTARTARRNTRATPATASGATTGRRNAQGQITISNTTNATAQSGGNRP